MKNKISVIVPVYNAQNTLERCVTSLIAQTYENIEIILVNDGSKDGSLVLCNQLAEQDSRILVVDKPNGGVSTARNAGLDVARGEYIMFCDSDDWVKPDWCKKMISCYEPGCMPICHIEYQDLSDGGEHGEKSVERIPRNFCLHYSEVMSSPVNKLYIRSVIEQNQLRFLEELRLGEDFVFAMEYLGCLEGELLLLPEALYYYDVSTEGSLSKRSASLEQCNLFYEKLTSAMERLGAVDIESINNRDLHVATQIENMLIAVSQNEDISFKQKWEIAGNTQKSECFRKCSAQGIYWGNPIYLWLLRTKKAKGFILYLLLRSVIKG